MPSRSRRPFSWIAALSIGGAFVAVFAASAFAQPTPQAPSAPEDLADRARIRLGPFYFQPWIALTDAGYDTNVFNDFREPKEDFTFMLSPAIDGGMRAGPARLNFRFLTAYVWYQTYKSEQGVDGQTRLEFEVRYPWLRPHVSAEWTNTRSRPGYEVDARAERNIPQYVGGVDVRIASRTWVITSYRHTETRFFEGQVYLGEPLDQALNNTTQTATAGLRLELTPLTTLSLTAQRQQVRFDDAKYRDNDNLAFLPTFDFNPDALLNGHATVGYRTLTAMTEGVPDFRGVVANVGLRYAPLSSTSFGISVDRDVAYSFEFGYPYYLLSGVAGSVSQRLVGSFEVTAQVRREWLDYRAVVGDLPTRTDVVMVYEAGAGYRLGDIGRFGLDVEWARRQSDSPEREYQGTRIFGSFRYGF